MLNRNSFSNRMLYIMHVDWQWIKQRPHFLAEELNNYYKLLVSFPHSNRRTNLIRNKSNVLTLPMPALPLARFKIIKLINSFIHHALLLAIIFIFRPTIIWFTFPKIVPSFCLKLFKNKFVIYDCMDDAPEFYSSEKDKISIKTKEQNLIHRADLILASSENLRNKLLNRGASETKIELVRNAFGDEKYFAAPAVFTSSQLKPLKQFRVLYFGTIDNYLDFPMLINCLEEIENVQFHFIGPLNTTVPKHERLIFHGAVEHSKLASIAHSFDCFIMPFIVNELILGVDPVKLYEYINLNKNIICPYYPEIHRFSDFVLFYENIEQFKSIIQKLTACNTLKYSLEQRNTFLKKNTWKTRAKQILHAINSRVTDVP